MKPRRKGFKEGSAASFTPSQGGKWRKKAVRLLAKKHLKVKGQRRDFHFKEARKNLEIPHRCNPMWVSSASG
jgi:hypothetical protein